MQKFIATILRCNGIDNPNAAADITELFSNALKGMYFATGRETICECEIPVHGFAMVGLRSTNVQLKTKR